MGEPRLLRVLARQGVRRAFDLGFGVVGRARRVLGRTGAHIPAEPRSILVVRVDLLGDVLFTMTLVQALRLRYPAARITMLTLPYTAPLARLYPDVDWVVDVDTNRIRTLRGCLNWNTWREYWRVVTELRAARFDLAISVSGRMASLWVTLSGAAVTTGYADEAYAGFLSAPLSGGRYGARRHEVEYDRRLAVAAGAVEVPDRLTLPVPRAAQQRIERLLSGVGILPPDRVVVIHAGSVNGSAKRWPPAYWAQFIDELATGVRVRFLLAGAASDAPIALAVARACRTHLVDLTGKTDVVELVALLARADLVASGDSGPLHLAVALGRPVLAVYGPTDPAVYGPYSPIGPTRLLRSDLPCSPCYPTSGSVDCPLGNPVCMRLVRVDSMVAAARELLATTTSDAGF